MKSQSVDFDHLIQKTDVDYVHCLGKGKSFQFGILIFFLAAIYAVAMIVLGGGNLTRLYGPSPYHREQAIALLNGHLNIRDSVYELDQNLVLYNGKIQHVWGLGVGLWLVPFEFVYRIFGQKEFPDRIAVGVAFVLLALYGIGTGVRFWRQGLQFKAALSFAFLILFCPSIFALNNGRHLIYEDTVLFGCLVSLGILIAVVRFVCFRRWSDFYICSILAGWAGLIRPTHVIYAAAGMLVCSLVAFFEKSSRKHLLFGNGILVGGMLILAGTNWLRFGSPVEFGHRLTATDGAMVYFTRFNNPFHSAPFWQASKELFGALFLSTDRVQLDSAEQAAPGQMFFAGLQNNVVKGQAPFPRWRDMYTTTFDWSYVLLTLCGLAASFWRLKKSRDKAPDWHSSECFITVALLWAALSLGGLWLFYLRFPILCSRYLFDLAPGFCAVILLVWFCTIKRLSTLFSVLLILWLGFEIRSAKGGLPKHYLLTRNEVLQSERLKPGRRIEMFNGRYSMEAHPGASGVPYNGEGWSEDTGIAGPIVVLSIDNPEFVTLDVGSRMEDGIEPGARLDIYRASMDGMKLPLEGITREEDLLKVHFKVPQELVNRKGNHLLFLCFIENCDEKDQSSERILHSISWRQENK